MLGVIVYDVIECCALIKCGTEATFSETVQAIRASNIRIFIKKINRCMCNVSAFTFAIDEKGM